jgi:hypothetical protein
MASNLRCSAIQQFQTTIRMGAIHHTKAAGLAEPQRAQKGAAGAAAKLS